MPALRLGKHETGVSKAPKLYKRCVSLLALEMALLHLLPPRRILTWFDSLSLDEYSPLDLQPLSQNYVGYIRESAACNRRN